MNIKKSAFTLVELIVVITILAVLWTIAFISFQWYMQSARDSVRLSDVWNIKKSIEIYYLNYNKYPIPSDEVDVTYKWWLAWKQWSFWDDTVQKSRVLNKKPVDPLYLKDYSYSTTWNWLAYELWLVVEDEEYLWYSPLTEVHAAQKKSMAKITGNYNWLLLKVKTWGLDYVLSVPSITSTDKNSTFLENIISENKLVYNGFWNLPHTYTWTNLDINGWFPFSPSNFELFSWSLSDLKQTWNQLILLKNLKESYSWSLLINWEPDIKKILNTDFDFENPTSVAKTIACNVVNFRLKYFVECWDLDFITFYVTNVLHIDINDIPWSVINIVFQDDDWNIWFWTDGGVWVYDETEWKYYDKDNSDLISNNISSISEDNSWNIWFWTNIWISKLDPDSDTWETFSHQNSDLLHNHILYIFTSSDWTIWIWTNKWISSYNSDVWDDYTKKKDWLSHNHVNSIYEDSIGNIWFWTDVWLDKYYSTWWTSSITPYTVSNTSNWLPSNKVSYIFEDSNNNIFAWTDSWIGLYVPDTDSWTAFTTSNTSNWLMSNNITYIYEDDNWEIWFWTDWWVSEYNVLTNNWLNNYNNSNLLSWNYIHTIYQDDNSNILILTDWWLSLIPQ